MGQKLKIQDSYPGFLIASPSCVNSYASAQDLASVFARPIFLVCIGRSNLSRRGTPRKDAAGVRLDLITKGLHFSAEWFTLSDYSLNLLKSCNSLLGLFQGNFVKFFDIFFCH